MTNQWRLRENFLRFKFIFNCHSCISCVFLWSVWHCPVLINRNVYIHSITFCKMRPLTKKETDFYKSTVTSIIRNSCPNQNKPNQNTNLFVCLFVNSVISQCIVDCPCHFFTDGLSLPKLQKENSPVTLHQSQQNVKRNADKAVWEDVGCRDAVLSGCPKWLSLTTTRQWKTSFHFLE